MKTNAELATEAREQIEDLQLWFASKPYGWYERATQQQRQQWDDRVTEQDRLNDLISRLEG